LENRDYPQAEYLRRARAAAAGVTLEPAERDGLNGQQIAQKLRRARLAALAELRK
jgi:tRNA nucleotidyltransferase (CCA-adding enzyme)